MPPAEPQPRTVGVIAPQLSSLYYGELIEGIQSILHPQQLRVLAIQGKPAEVAASRLAADLVSSWIVLSNADQIEQLAAQGKPIVTVGVLAAGQGIPAVLPDNANGMQAAVQHLIEHGHRRIAFAGHLAHFDTRQRYAGYLSALAAAGLADDPGLCLDLPANGVPDGIRLAQQVSRPGRDYTALALATDELALGVIAGLGEAGVQLPAELALVGFDNIIPAQFVQPAITTVHVAVHAVGVAAAQLIVSLLQGQPAPDTAAAVRGRLIVRASCGCQLGRFAQVAPPAAQQSWVLQLRQQLVYLLMPSAAGQAQALESIWPAGEPLIEHFVAVVEGSAPLDRALVLQASQATARAFNELDATLAVPAAFEQAALHAIIPQGDIAGYRRCTEFVALLRATLVSEAMNGMRALYRSALGLVHQNQQASVRLLSDDDQDIRQLGWMQATSFAWGRLGLWQHHGATSALRLAGAYGQQGAPAPPAGTLIAAAAFPPEPLPAAAPHPAELTALVPIRSPSRDWGVLAVTTTSDYLRAATNYDALGVLAMLLDLALNRQLLRERFRHERERTTQLAEQVRELSCPVIPLLPGVLLVPLIGTLDAARSPQIIEAVLQGITEHQASEVLIDITGVPLVDTQAANALMQTTRAATLLGARVTLAGIRPEIAQSIVGLGIDLRLITTEATLSTAIRRLVRGVHPLA